MNQADKVWVRDYVDRQIKPINARLDKHDSRITALEQAGVPDVPDVPDVPVDPTLPPRTPSGPLEFGSGDHVAENLDIHANPPYIPPGSSYFAGGQGISCSAVGKLTVHNCGVSANRYGIWADADEFLLDHVNVTCAPSGAGDGDDYACRGDVDKWRSNDCTFKSVGKAVLRLYGVDDLISLRDRFEGPRMLLGRGNSDEHVNPQKFVGDFNSGWINCPGEGVIVGPLSIVTFDNMDFAGTSKITVDAGGKCVVKPTCKNVPPIDGVVTTQ
jgi:hypothetical protein